MATISLSLYLSGLNRTLRASRVIIAVIGPAWATAKEASGSRRLDNPDDYVVRELSAVLTSNARVIPVLVGGASMPRTDNLPAALHPLARRNAIEISDAALLNITPSAGEARPTLGTEVALSVVIVVLQLWAIRIMFTDPVKRIFERQ